jgi:hypothetical protein
VLIAGHGVLEPHFATSNVERADLTDGRAATVALIIMAPIILALLFF